MQNDPSFKPITRELKVAAWLKKIVSAGCRVDSCESLSSVYKSDKSLLFSFMHAIVTSPEGYTLPGYCFVRGDGCVIVPLIKNRLTGDERLLMVIQRRIGHGWLSLEFPAGMLDEQISEPLTVAQRELEEETGLRINSQQIFMLHDQPLYTSAGGCDEALYFFGCIIELEDHEYRSYEGRIAGACHENEHVSVTLRTREQALRELTSAPGHLALHLFNQYVAQTM